MSRSNNKNDISIKVVIKGMMSNRIKWRKKKTYGQS